MSRTETFTSSCTASGGFGYASYFTLYVTLTDRDGNSSSNVSYIDYNVYCQSSGSGSISANHTLYFKLGDTVITNSLVAVNVKSPNAKIQIASGTLSNVAHNDDGSGSISYEASIVATGGYGVNSSQSGTFTLETISRYANLTSLIVKSITVDTITLSYTTDRNAWIFINLNNGESWLNGGEPFASNTTSGTITISYKDRASTKKLDPNTTYTITVLCRALNRDSELDTSQNVTATTYDIARISSVSNFEHGSNASVVITNPASISSLTLTMSVSNTQIFSKTVSTGTNTISFSDTELDNIYKKYGTDTSLTATFVLTGSGYTNTKTCTITLKGNQKTARLKVSDTWKRGKLWVNVGGTWKRAIAWENINGTWKRCI